MNLTHLVHCAEGKKAFPNIANVVKLDFYLLLRKAKTCIYNSRINIKVFKIYCYYNSFYLADCLIQNHPNPYDSQPILCVVQKRFP